MATNAKYKVYNGSSWVEYHFTTNAGQVSTTSSRKFLTTSVTVNSNTAGTTGAKVTVGENDAANIEIDGAHIAGKATAVSGSSLQYVTINDDISVALGKLDKAAKDAYDHVPSNCLTYGDGGNFGTQNPDLAAIEGLSGTSGFLKKTAANTWSLDDTSYVPTTRTVNGKALSTSIEIGPNDIPMMPGLAGSATLAQKLQTMDSTIAGMGNAIVINVDGTFDSAAKNAQLKSTNDDVTISFANSTEGLSKVTYNIMTETTELVVTFHLGDVVYIKQTDYPDRWVSAITMDTNNLGHSLVTFSKLETYNMTWAAISGKPSSYTPASHTHGNITNDGKITATAVTTGAGVVVVDSSNVIQKMTDAASVRTLIGAYAKPSTGIPGTDLATSYVPYTGANGPVDLGTQTIKAGQVIAQADGGNTTIAFSFGIMNAPQISVFKLNTYNRAWNLPTKESGTIALTSDIPTVVVGTSGPTYPISGNIWIDTTA